MKTSNALPAHDFTLVDTAGRQVRLSDYLGTRNVLIVFLRGFT